MREKQLALMRERNLYLEKCRQIEEYGESVEWGGEDSYDNEGSQEITEEQKLLQEVYDILYTEKWKNESMNGRILMIFVNL